MRREAEGEAMTPTPPVPEMTTKRYDLITNHRCGSSIEEMEPSDDGEWIRYDTVADVLASERAALAAARIPV